MMSVTSRRELLAVVAPRYRAARGQERSRILEEFVASTNYHRKYALSVLNHPMTKGTAHKKRVRPRLGWPHFRRVRELGSSSVKLLFEPYWTEIAQG